MNYQGSKRRIAKYILPIILKGRKSNQYYIEPFCGGCNSIDKVDGNRLANDSNYYLICLLEKIRDGWQPPVEISKKEYLHIKNNKNAYPPHLVGFVGFCCSFGTRWFNSYANTKDPKRNHLLERRRNLLKQAVNLKGIRFISGSYLELSIPEGSIIYCDPPYQNTAKYKDEIDHKKFWAWVREKSLEGHSVFVSEYNAPEDFICLFSKEIRSTLSSNSNSIVRIEKLFKWKG